MNGKTETSGSRNRALTTLGERMIMEWKGSRRGQPPMAPGLVIRNPSTPWPDYGALAEKVDGMLLRLDSGHNSTPIYWGEIKVVHSHSSALPLQSSSFGLVMLSHVIRDGTEIELEEARRVLQPGGVLLILGLNRNGLRYFSGRSLAEMPGLRPLAVREQLERHDVQVESLLAAGFLNRLWPENLNHGMSRLLIPVADSLMIVAKKEEPQVATPLKRKQLRAVGAPSALAGP